MKRRVRGGGCQSGEPTNGTQTSRTRHVGLGLADRFGDRMSFCSKSRDFMEVTGGNVAWRLGSAGEKC